MTSDQTLTTSTTPADKPKQKRERKPIRPKLEGQATYAAKCIAALKRTSRDVGDSKALDLAEKALSAYVISLSGVPADFIPHRQVGNPGLQPGSPVWASKSHANALAKYGTMKLVSIDNESGVATVELSDGSQKLVARSAIVGTDPAKSEAKKDGS